MKVQFYKPKNKTLEKYIEGYYFISENEISQPVKYWTFPNNYCILSVNLNSNLIIEKNRMLVTPSSLEKFIGSLVFRYSNPMEIIYEGPVNEITVYFKPLGLNHFATTLDEFSKGKSITDYNPFPDFKEIMSKIIKDTNREQQIKKLENYWLSKLQIQDLSLMELILSDIEANLKIDDIAKKHKLTRQYISRLFLKMIGKTPSEYRKIHRFRNSIITKKKVKNLTELSYENLFFDQSHFIKDFRELTSGKPSAFFKNVDTEKGNVWLFI